MPRSGSAAGGSPQPCSGWKQAPSPSQPQPRCCPGAGASLVPKLPGRSNRRVAHAGLRRPVGCHAVVLAEDSDTPDSQVGTAWRKAVPVSTIAECRALLPQHDLPPVHPKGWAALSPVCVHARLRTPPWDVPDCCNCLPDLCGPPPAPTCR